MPDREKLVIAIERAKEQSEEYGLDRILVDFKAVDMILELLKEQEAKPVIVTTNAYGTRFYHCPKCNRDLYVYPRQLHCSNCGQAVKWE